MNVNSPSRDRRPLLAVVLLLLSTAVLRAEVSLPKIIGDNLVLQRDCAVPIWGGAAPGEKVTVAFAGQEKSAVADASGRWAVKLDPLAASAEPREMTVAGASTIRLTNILVGEVWLCSGQSNMEYALGVAKKWAPAAAATDPVLAAEMKKPAWPQVRLFLVEKKLAAPEVVSTGWHEASGAARDEFSAVGGCFGLELQRRLGVPVGLIESSWGGSRIEEWTPREAYARLEAEFTGAAALSYERDSAFVGRNYDAMVKPLAPYALRGVIWYQGESNVLAYNDGPRYEAKMRTWADSWRAAWQRLGMPFYFVQVAPFLYSPRKDKIAHSPQELPLLWEAQAAAARRPGMGVVATIDLVPDVANIHPPLKREVGLRLAGLALERTYGKPGPAWQSPEFAGLEIRGNEAIVKFAHTGGRLMVRDGGEPAEFEIAGADSAFVAAKASIQGDTVVVSSPAVAVPCAVRFAWNEAARPNLTGANGLPVYPFRSNPPAK